MPLPGTPSLVDSRYGTIGIVAVAKNSSEGMKALPRIFSSDRRSK
jgi:hypothetical protein